MRPTSELSKSPPSPSSSATSTRLRTRLLNRGARSPTRSRRSTSAGSPSYVLRRRTTSACRSFPTHPTTQNSLLHGRPETEMSAKLLGASSRSRRSSKPRRTMRRSAGTSGSSMRRATCLLRSWLVPFNAWLYGTEQTPTRNRPKRLLRPARCPSRVSIHVVPTYDLCSDMCIQHSAVLLDTSTSWTRSTRTRSSRNFPKL